MHKRARQAITAAVTGVTLAAGATATAEATTTASSSTAPSSTAPFTAASSTTATTDSTTDSTTGSTTAIPQVPSLAQLTQLLIPSLPQQLTQRAAPQLTQQSAPPIAQESTLPTGTATATSFWDAETASGKPMRYETLASPYWPLGTKVKITYKGRSAIGVVEDFGPAEWAVAQHDIPAIVDLSEKMMADLTGVNSNSVHVGFEVLKWGKGRVYRDSGTGYDLAMGRS